MLRPVKLTYAIGRRWFEVVEVAVYPESCSRGALCSRFSASILCSRWRSLWLAELHAHPPCDNKPNSPHHLLVYRSFTKQQPLPRRSETNLAIPVKKERLDTHRVCERAHTLMQSSVLKALGCLILFGSLLLWVGGTLSVHHSTRPGSCSSYYAVDRSSANTNVCVEGINPLEYRCFFLTKCPRSEGK